MSRRRERNVVLFCSLADRLPKLHQLNCLLCVACLPGGRHMGLRYNILLRLQLRQREFKATACNYGYTSALNMVCWQFPKLACLIYAWSTHNRWGDHLTSYPFCTIRNSLNPQIHLNNIKRFHSCFTGNVSIPNPANTRRSEEWKGCFITITSILIYTQPQQFLMFENNS